MKSGYLFCLVLLIVLAIPLFADHTLVNPVGEFSAISTINSEEEKGSELYMTETFEIVAIKPDEIVIPLPEVVVLVHPSDLALGNNGWNRTITHGGIKRTNLRKH